MSPLYDAFDVPVQTGNLHVGRWRSATGGRSRGGPDQPIVLAAHGVTANHLAWAKLADHSPFDVVAPDLRGRGRSSEITGPAGMAAHAADLLAVLDHLGAERAILLGHSMGGFVVTTFAEQNPDRTASVLLVDGGLPLPEPPPGITPDQALATTIGPASERLKMTFTDLDAYLDFWRDHPALAADWSPEVEAYLAYDLVGTPPACRSSVSLAGVHDDSVDLLDTARVAARVRALPAGTKFLRATSGMMGEPGGLYPRALAAEHAAAYPRLKIRDVEGVNHYTLVMAGAGARIVADVLREEAG